MGGSGLGVWVEGEGIVHKKITNFFERRTPEVNHSAR